MVEKERYRQRDGERQRRDRCRDRQRDMEIGEMIRILEGIEEALNDAT